MQAINQRLDKSVTAMPWYETADFYNKTVALFSKQVGVLKFIIAAIIILSISNTLIMSVLERTSEIGTMMALGASRNAILRCFLGEGVVLGLLGGLLGVIAGVALALVISAIGVPMPAPPGMAWGYIGEVRTTFLLVFDAFALAVVTTLRSSVARLLSKRRIAQRKMRPSSASTTEASP